MRQRGLKSEVYLAQVRGTRLAKLKPRVRIVAPWLYNSHVQ